MLTENEMNEADSSVALQNREGKLLSSMRRLSESNSTSAFHFIRHNKKKTRLRKLREERNRKHVFT